MEKILPLTIFPPPLSEIGGEKLSWQDFEWQTENYSGSHSFVTHPSPAGEWFGLEATPECVLAVCAPRDFACPL